MRGPWVETVTRPVSHLVSTCVVFIVLVACVVLSTIYPLWTATYAVIAAVPAAIWYPFMMKAYKQNRARWVQQIAPRED